MKKQTLRYRFVLIAATLLVMALSFVSCAKGSDYRAEADSPSVNKSTSDYESSSNGSSGIGGIPAGTPDEPGAKIIKTANASLSTLEYDTFIENLYAKIVELGGHTDTDTFSGSKPYRSASITARIPADKLESFKEFLSSSATLTRYSAKKEDVSIRYATLTAELETLTAKKSAIEALLDKATALSEIATLTDALYTADASINKIQAELDSYDDRIAYSTVYLNVREVTEAVESEKKGVFKRIGEGFTDSLESVGRFIVDFFVWFLSSIPQIILIGAVGTGAFFALRKIRRIKKARKALLDKKENNTTAGESAPENEKREDA